MSAVRKHSRSLLPTPEACTAQANKNSSPATNTFSAYLAAQGLDQLLAGKLSLDSAPPSAPGTRGSPEPGARTGPAGGPRARTNPSPSRFPGREAAGMTLAVFGDPHLVLH